MFLASGCRITRDPDPSNFFQSSFCEVCYDQSTTDPPTASPTNGRNARPGVLPINSTAQLYAAVDAYLQDPSPDSEVAYYFGYPIGIWDVSRLTNFSRVFDAERVPRASGFDEDLSGWATDNAETMDRMFRGASNFNGDVSSWNTGKVANMSAMCR